MLQVTVLKPYEFYFVVYVEADKVYITDGNRTREFPLESQKFGVRGVPFYMEIWEGRPLIFMLNDNDLCEFEYIL